MLDLEKNRREIFKNVFRYSFDYALYQKEYYSLFFLSSSICRAALSETPALPTEAIRVS